MEEKDRKQIKKTGRKPKIDPAVHRYSLNLNDEDNAKFLALFDQSGMKVIAHLLNFSGNSEELPPITIRL